MLRCLLLLECSRHQQRGRGGNDWLALYKDCLTPPVPCLFCSQTSQDPLICAHFNQTDKEQSGLFWSDTVQPLHKPALHGGQSCHHTELEDSSNEKQRRSAHRWRGMGNTKYQTNRKDNKDHHKAKWSLSCHGLCSRPTCPFWGAPWSFQLHSSPGMSQACLTSTGKPRQDTPGQLLLQYSVHGGKNDLSCVFEFAASRRWAFPVEQEEPSACRPSATSSSPAPKALENTLSVK